MSRHVLGDHDTVIASANVPDGNNGYILKNFNIPWEKTPFIASLPSKAFESYEEAMAYMCDPENESLRAGAITGTVSAREAVQELTAEKYLRLNGRDTSLGGNEAINCYPQFNEDDDIVHLATAARTRNVNGKIVIDSGLGRVYSEVFDSTQKVMYLSAGVPKYSGILNFCEFAIDKDAAALLHGTETEGMGRKIGSAIGTLAMLPLNIMFLPLRYFNKTITSLNRDAVTKYYDFWSDMVLYYKYVNDILIHLHVNLGLAKGSDMSAGTKGVTGNSVQKYAETQKRSEQEANTGDGTQYADLGYLEDGIDIYRILSRREFFSSNLRNMYENANSPANRPAGSSAAESNTQKAYDERVGRKAPDNDSGEFSPTGNFLGEIARSAWNAATSGDRFIGVKIEKTTDSSESFSNSTGESSIAQAMNSVVSSARENMFKIQGGAVGNGGGLMTTAANQAIGMVQGGVKAVTSTAASGLGALFGMEGAISFGTNMITGNAYIDIPEVWTGSQYSKSYSFNIDLRDPHGGNPISFIVNIGVPLACMLALTLPRSAGENSFGSPFLVRAYCKGMFAIPLGMIDNMTITRGAPEHGWSVYGLPTVVNISFGIKDLATVMHMALNDSGGPAMFGANSPFQEYLLTLSSVGMKERLLFLPKAHKKAAYWMQKVNEVYLNPHFWGMQLGHTRVGQAYGVFSKFSGFQD